MKQSLPLNNIRVLDLTRIAAGPFATMLMSDLGAEVLKIERPETGDDVRNMGQSLSDHDPLTTDYFVALNRTKRSIAVDLSADEGREVVLKLAASCDVVVENFRPGVADRLGVGFEDVRTLRPNLVYTSVSGFGPTGPWIKRPANDIVMQSLSGLMALTGSPDGPPQRLGSSLTDYATGVFALAGTLAALFARNDFPEGQHVEVPMLNASIAMVPNLIPGASMGTPARRTGHRHPQLIGYATYECAGGGFVTVGAFTEGFWRRLCTVVGHEEWLDDPRLRFNSDRVKHRSELESELERVFATKRRDHWVEELARNDIPVAPVLEIEEAIFSEQAVHSEAVWTLDQAGKQVGVVANPVRCEAWGPSEPLPAERLGSSSRTILTQIVGDDYYDDLLADGVVGEDAAAPDSSR